MKNGTGRQGFIGIKTLLFLLTIVVILFVGLSFAKPYYRYIVLRSHTSDFLKLDIGNTKTIREKILDLADEVKVPLKGDNLDVRTTKNKIVKVSASWTEVVDFWGYYQKRLNFDMELEY